MRNPALRRFTGLLRKEFLQILRDPSALAIAFVLPAVLLLIIGQGVSLDARSVPIALVVQNPDSLTASFTGRFEQSPYFRPVHFRDIQSAEVAMAANKVQGIVWLPSNFSRRAKARGNSPIGVIVNGVDANDARLVEGYVQQVWSTWLTAQAQLQGKPSPLPIDVAARVRFNPGVSSRDYLVPGLIALIMTLTGALLTALVMAREWERGTLEALMVTRVKMREIILAKLVPYFLLGMGGMAASVAYRRVPFRHSAKGLATGTDRHLGPVHACRPGHGPAYFQLCPQPVRRRPDRHHYHLSAGVYPLGFCVRHREHAAVCPVHYPYCRRPLLRGYPAVTVPRWRRLVGDPA